MQTRRSRLLLKTCSDTAISPYLENVILSADASVSQTPLQGRDSPQFRREESKRSSKLDYYLTASHVTTIAMR